MEPQDFLREYLNNSSPTGFEVSGQRLWLDYITPFVDTWFSDPYGTVVGIINPDAEYKVVVEAHADEISWFVNYITEDGLLYVRRNGGSDAAIAPSMRVNIHTERGMVRGVFGWPAIHVRKPEEEKAPKVEGLTIDIGATSKADVLEMGIHVGSVATFQGDFEELGGRYYMARALDNRIGGYMIAEVARRLKESGQRPDFGIYFVNAVQEEIGLRGAEMIAARIKPNVALVTDVCHDTTTNGYKKPEHGDQRCGQGPVLSYGPAVHNNLLKFVIETAQANQIDFQRAAVSRATGTDTDAFAYSSGGIPSALVSLPLKYMHTTVEMVHKDDVAKVIDLLYNCLLRLQPGQDFSYFPR